MLDPKTTSSFFLFFSHIHIVNPGLQISQQVANMSSKPDSEPQEFSLKVIVDESQLEDTPQKSRWQRSWPTIACGAGLFSDGYLNGVCPFCPLDIGRP